jgi:uncharacterized protein (TIGR00369 family)
MNTMDKNRNYKEIHNTDTNTCFGCSPTNSFGLQMKFFSNEETVYSWPSIPEHMGGWKKIVHGGIVSTILDEIMSWAALHLLKKVTLTTSMTVDFIKAVRVGEKLRAEGRVIAFNGKRTALVEGFLFNQQDELCAKSKGDFTVLSPKLAKRIGIVTDDHIKEFFEPLIASQ